ncbi:MAG: hypothetical protein ACPGRE_08670 [Flavobacteriaceae bacterium]
MKAIKFVLSMAVVMAFSSQAFQAQQKKNPFLADSNWPIGHTNAAQTNATPIDGPVGETRSLNADEIQYQDMGQFYLGQVISGIYENGKKVIWCNGSSFVAKLDYDNYNVISMLRITDVVEDTGKHEAFIDMMDSDASIETKLKASAKAGISGLSSVYILINHKNEFVAAQPRGVRVYGDVEQGNPGSGIAIRKEFKLPDSVKGKIVGMNMTYDGTLLLVTNAGYVVALNEDLEEASIVRMRYSETYQNTQVAFVRNSIAVDSNDGIYIASVNHMHKIIWDGSNLSQDEQLGAWTAEYPNNFGLGTGSTPALMGFGEGNDQFVVITDGDKVMNMTLFWRNGIPKKWKGIKGLPSERIAASYPVNFGNEQATYVQQEQGVTINGYGMIVVNNVPNNVPSQVKQLADKNPKVMWLFMGFMNGYEQFAPKGIEKLVWNPDSQKIELAWINEEVSDPTCVPFVADGNNMFYTIGSRNNQFTFEGIDATTGESVFHYLIGGARYNGFYSAPTLDSEGRILYGGLWGVVRLDPK